MARPARIEYEGACYHVMNRGNRKEDIFTDYNDRQKFYEILGNIENRYGIIIYVFVLMSNHYHILLETPFANLSRAMQRLNGEYALYFTKRHKRPGHVFQGRFKAMLVEKEAYLLELSRYIHLNPVRAKINKSPETYYWSSLPEYLKGESKLPFKLHWEWILSIYGKRRSIATRKYLEFVREGIKDIRNPGKEATGGWILGSEAWVKRITEKWGHFSSDELSGVKPLNTRIPVTDMEELVCNEFGVEKDQLRKVSYNNKARLAIMYLTVNYCGLTLKDAGQRYGGANYSAVGKAVSRFRERFTEDQNIQNISKQIKKIMSIVEM